MMMVYQVRIRIDKKMIHLLTSLMKKFSVKLDVIDLV